MSATHHRMQAAAVPQTLQQAPRRSAQDLQPGSMAMPSNSLIRLGLNAQVLTENGA